MIAEIQFWAAPRSTRPTRRRPLLFHMTGHRNTSWSLCGTARHLATHRRIDACTVPATDRCRAFGCADAWPPIPQSTHSPAAICHEDRCTAVATHATHRLGATESYVFCHWCAARYQHRYYPAATLTELEAHAVALAAAAPNGFLYKITTGILGDPQPAGTCNAAEARLRLNGALRDGWAVQVQPSGGWRAADITAGGFVGELTHGISLDPYPIER